MSSIEEFLSGLNGTFADIITCMGELTSATDETSVEELQECVYECYAACLELTADVKSLMQQMRKKYHVKEIDVKKRMAAEEAEQCALTGLEEQCAEKVTEVEEEIPMVNHLAVAGPEVIPMINPLIVAREDNLQELQPIVLTGMPIEIVQGKVSNASSRSSNDKRKPKAATKTNADLPSAKPKAAKRSRKTTA